MLQSAVILAVSVLKGPDPWSGWSPPCAAFAYSQEPPWTASAASQGLGLRNGSSMPVPPEKLAMRKSTVALFSGESTRTTF